MPLWRYRQFNHRYHAQFRDTFSVRLGGLPVAIPAKDRHGIRRLFTGEPLVTRHGYDNW
jgi:hypothetical protein